MSFNYYQRCGRCWLPQATSWADAFIHSLPDHEIRAHLMFRVDVRFSVEFDKPLAT